MTARRGLVLALALSAGASALGGAALGLGCTSFDAAAEAPDGATALGDAKANGDGSPAPDAAPQLDAGPPCADRRTVVFGATDLDLSHRAADSINAQTRDAHFFAAHAAGTASCAWLYIVQPPAQGTVYFGVYADKSGVPDALLARARFDNPVAGWNSIPLDSSVTVAPGMAMWIAVGPDRDQVLVSSITDAGCSTHSFTGKLDAGVGLADPFLGSNRYPSCDLAAYLGP